MASQSPLRFYLLGNFRVENDNGVVKLATKPTAALLAYLVLHRNTWHERAQLATLFWGSEAANELRRRASNESVDKLARTSFRKALSTLRKQFGTEFILDNDDGKKIRLNPDAQIWVDAEEFWRIADSKSQIAKTNEPSSLHAPPSTLHLYRGDLLQEFSDDPDSPWLDALREKYREQFVQMCLTLAQHARERGEWAQVIEYAQLAHARDAYNETAVQHLIVAYARQGDTERALKIYAELERVLFQEVGSAPSNSTRVLRRHIERNATREGKDGMAYRLSNLPTPLTPFLGRENELEKIRGLLQTSRLVTLVGTGGSGKTRLAIHLARESLGKDASPKRLYSDGVWWIRLEELDKETGSVAQSIAHVLSVRGDAGRPILETMCEQLRDSEMLLVLDNCEHLLADCARVCEQLLNACPQIKILATSRERLHVAGEVDFSVPPLPLPSERAQIAALEKSEAIKFFLHYARYARGDFGLRETNASAVAQICRRLDGIPLALELAAARVKTISAEYIAEHLDERFELLSAQHRTIARHQTLRAVLDWSYELLDDAEKRVFAALSVFAARFTLDAAQYVCDDSSRTRDILESLADKSLVLVEFDANDAVRYRLLETIREYAREKLAASPERLTATNERLSKYYLQFSQQHAKNYLAIEDEWNNIATGMSIAHERQDWQPLLDYGQSVTDALFARGLYTDARRIIPWVITAADREEEQERSIEAMYKWGSTYINQSLYDDARNIMEKLLALSEAARDKRGMAMALFGLGLIEKYLSKYDAAIKNHEQALALSFETEQLPLTADILLELGRINYRQGNNARAKEYVYSVLTRFETSSTTVQSINAFQTLAIIARVEKEVDEAEQFARRALEESIGQHNKVEIASSYFILAQVAEDRKRYFQARDYYFQSRLTFEEIQDPRSAAYISDALCGLFTEMGQLEQAEESGRNALLALTKLGERGGVIASSRRLGIALAKMNRIQEACELWHQALALAKKTGDFRIPYLETLLEEYCE